MRQRGITVLEVVIALSVVIVLVTAALGGEQAQQRAVSRAYSDLAASRAAASRIETLTASEAPLKSGSSPFEPTLAGGVGTQRVRVIAAGYYEVEIEVVHPGDGARAVLTTRVVREPMP